MKKKDNQFEYVYVDNNGSVRELYSDEIDYLKTMFSPTDGNRPYIKNSYKQLTPDKKISKRVIIINKELEYLSIRKPISIYDSGKLIDISESNKYSVKVIGGWDVKVGDFTFTLKNIKTGNIINPELTNWRVQSYEFGERAKKIMKLEIPETGKYCVEFKNQETLQVRPSNIFIRKLFEKEIPNGTLSIWIG